MYSNDFRLHAVRIFHLKKSYNRASHTMHISSSTLHRWVNDGIGVVARRKRKPSKVSELVVQVLCNFVLCTPVTTLRQVRLHIDETLGVCLHSQTIARTMKQRCGLSRKRTSKRLSGGKSSPLPEAVLSFTERLTQHVREGNLIVSIDECYFSEKVLPLYGYSMKGTKCVVHAPTASWTQRSLLMGVASDGQSKPYVVHDGAINGASFSAFINSLPYPPGTVLVMDNVAFHKNLFHYNAKQYIVLFTPPYSPQFNPIEYVFSKVKGRFRALWPWKTIGGVIAAITNAIDDVTSTDILAIFNHVQTISTAR